MLTFTLFASLDANSFAGSYTASWADWFNKLSIPCGKTKNTGLPLVGFYSLKNEKAPRCDDNIDKIYALALDYEETYGTVPTLDEFEVPFEHLIYTTPSHTEALPRYRVVVPLAEPISPDKIPHAFSELLEWVPLSGLDPSCADVSRSFFVHSSKTPQPFTHPRKLGTGLYFEPLLVDTELYDKWQKTPRPKPINGVSTGGRNDTLKAQACAAIGIGKSIDEVVKELVDYDQTYHNPPLFMDSSEPNWGDGNTASKRAESFIRRVTKRITVPLTHGGTVVVQKPDKIETINPSSKVVKVISFRDFLPTKFAKKEHYIGPFVKQGVSLVYAATGVGKTHFCMGLAIAIATGTDFLRWKSESKAKVLYIDGELPAHYLQTMLAPLGDSLQDGSVVFDIITPDTQEDALMPNLATLEGQIAIKGAIDNADVVFIDNLSTLVRSGKENDAEYWAPMQEWFLGLRRRGKSVIFAHHSGKGESGSFRGTSKITDAVDLAVYLKSPMGHTAEDGCVFNVSFPKYRHYRKGDATEFEATYESNRGLPCWSYRELEAINSNRVLELHNMGLKPKDIEIELGLSKKTIYKHLNAGGVELQKTRPSLKLLKPRKDTDDDSHF